MPYGSLDQRKVVCIKKKGPDSRDEKVICLLSNFLERQTDIVAYIEVLYAIKRDLLRSIFKFKEWNSLEINNVDIQNVQVEHNMNIYIASKTNLFENIIQETLSENNNNA